MPGFVKFSLSASLALCGICVRVLGTALPVTAAQPAPVPAPAAPVVKRPAFYTVELLIFRSTSAARGGEDLTVHSSRSLSSDSDSAASATEATTVRLGQKLPASRYRLSGEEARLNSSGAWRSVAHIAWTQTASAWGSRSGLSAAQLGLDGAGIDGAIYLERGQYLHLGVNLTIAGNAGTYALTEMRRVKSNERNYFDHPVYGVIAVVTPPSNAAASPE